jgi:hypothetical protein
MKNMLSSMVIVFVFIIISFGSAQNFGFSGIGVFGGAIMPEDWDTGFNIGGGVSLGPLSDGLYLFPNVVYWEATVEEEGMPDESTLSNIGVNIDVHYFFQDQQEGAFVSGGISYNSLAWEYPYFAFVPQQVLRWAESSEDKVGFQIGLGYLINFGSISGLLEAKYYLIEDFNPFQVSAGIMFAVK